MVSYNILSSRYTYQDDAYSYCADEFLVIDYRKLLILNELLGEIFCRIFTRNTHEFLTDYNADILCLQEVDDMQYLQFFKPELEKKGYVTKFYRKGFYLTEGMLSAVRKSRFK